MTSHLTIPTETFADRWARRAFVIEHDLTSDPRVQLGALAELADALPPGSVEHNLGKLPEVLPGGEVPHAELTPGEIVRGIETNGCWAVLPLHVLPKGTMEPYRELFSDLLGELRARLGGPGQQIRAAQAVFFLSAPGSVTPTHIDPEQGFLLQLRGTKRLVIGEFDDVETRQREIERIELGGHRNVAKLPEQVETFPLAPGEGVHVPAFVPHAVHNGSEVSLSLSIGVRTRETLSQASVHWWNGRLRRLGLSPSAPGVRPRRDKIKVRTLDTARDVLRRH